ncbi:hypothetical protein G6F31_014576 [Rhizopus arrhizus]|nr:hypothetical protein G6F31_014576 [Rhizopus arrhizus]
MPAPGNGAQRQEVARQLERDGAQQPGDEERQHQSGQQGQPGGVDQPGQPGRQGVGAGGEQRRGVGAHAHEGGLSAAGQSAHPGQQHQAQRHQRIQADVVQQGHVERRQGQRPQRQQRQEYEEDDAGQHGDDQREYDDFLVGAGPERREGFDQAHQDGAGRGQRIADHTADDGAYEALQADHEAGVEVHGGDGGDEDARHRADQRGQDEGGAAGEDGGNAHQPRAQSVEGGGAQRLAVHRAFKELVQHDDQHRRHRHHPQRLAVDVDGAECQAGVAEGRGARAFGAESQKAQADQRQMDGDGHDQQHQRRGRRDGLVKSACTDMGNCASGS